MHRQILVTFAATLTAGLSALLTASTARAELRLGAGAHYALSRQGYFHGELAADTTVAGPLTGGARFGVLLGTGPAHLGVPIDLGLGLRLGRAYVQGYLGPWFFLDGQGVRLHAAFGFGVRSGRLRVGLEAGWLEPRALIGLTLATSL